MQSITGESQVFGIIGNPVSHSISPMLHNRAFERAGFHGVYVPFAVDRTGPFLKTALLHLGLGGVSVTIPHKVWAARASDIRDPLVEITGAANTILVREKHRVKRLEAYNTDGPGAVRALKTALPDLSGKRILVAGYGGSARAIVGQLLLTEKPGRIAIHGRNRAKIRSFINFFKKKNSPKRGGGLSFKPDCLSFFDESADEQAAFDIIINTTPLGMKGFDLALPVPEGMLRPGMVVMDIVYVPEMTPLLEAARAKKARIVPGYLMLLYQALLQYELFTDLQATGEVESLMRIALTTALHPQSRKA